MTLRQFIDSRRIRAHARWAPSNPSMDDMPAGSSHWRVTLTHGRKRMTVPFSQGPAHTREPDAYDVLTCLRSDASSVNAARDFEDWCSDFGLDTDSRRAEKTYRACRDIAVRLLAFIGDGDWNAFAEAEE